MLSVETSAPAFSAALDDAVLAPGASASVELRFLPEVPGELRGTLTLTLDSPGGEVVTVPLVGRGTAAPRY